MEAKKKLYLVLLLIKIRAALLLVWMMVSASTIANRSKRHSDEVIDVSFKE